MIRPEVLEILRCPKTHQKLIVADADLVTAMNERIRKRELRNRGGETLDEALEGGLLCEDGTFLYPIRGKLPIMLVHEAIPAR